MEIKHLKIYGFGSVVNREYDFPDGTVYLGLREGEGELLFDFIRAMLYGISGRGDVGLRKKYYPSETLDNDGKKVRFGGEMIFRACGKLYREVCLWGRTAGDDSTTLEDPENNRNVRMDPGKTVGEHSMRLSEGAFCSAALLRSFPEYSEENGFGTLSGLLGICDGKPSPKEIRDGLEERLFRLKNGRDKTGELDALMIKKFNMKNELTRLNECDRKIAEGKKQLDELENTREELTEKLSESQRLFSLSESAKALLNKDRVTALYGSLNLLLKQLDDQKEERERLKKQSPLKKVLPGVIIALVGAVLLWLSFSLIPDPSLTKIVRAVSLAVICAGLAASLVGLIRFAFRFHVTVDGRKTTLDDVIERLKSEISDKNKELSDYLGNSDYLKTAEKWRKAEDTMRTATEEERRYAVLKHSEELEQMIASMKTQTEPLDARIEKAKADINHLCDAANKTFSDASAALEGIDAKIREKTEEYNSLKLALAVMEESIAEFSGVTVPLLTGEAAKTYRNIGLGNCKYTVDDCFRIFAECEDREAALLCLQAAVSKFISAESDRQILFLPKGAGSLQKDLLDRLILGSDIAQIFCVSEQGA